MCFVCLGEQSPQEQKRKICVWITWRSSAANAFHFLCSLCAALALKSLAGATWVDELWRPLVDMPPHPPPQPSDFLICATGLLSSPPRLFLPHSYLFLHVAARLHPILYLLCPLSAHLSFLYFFFKLHLLSRGRGETITLPPCVLFFNL